MTSVEEQTNTITSPGKMNVSSSAFLAIPETPETLASYVKNNENKNDAKEKTLAIQWARLVNNNRTFINRLIQWLAHQAASYPKRTIAITIIISLTMMTTGILTNFSMGPLDGTHWLPRGSRSVIHKHWILEDSGLNAKQRNIMITVHADGVNVAGMEGPKRAFEVVDTIKSLSLYDEFCAPGAIDDEQYSEEFADGCPLWGVTQFWSQNSTIFESQIHSDLEATTAMSTKEYPDGQLVHPTSVMGNVGILYGTVVFVQSYPLYMMFPPVDGIEDLEAELIERVFELGEKWKEQGSIFKVEAYAPRSLPDELVRGSLVDIPLVPFCFVVMAIFTCLVFARRDAVKSRSVLGVGAVVTVGLSIVLAYGFLFCLGVQLSAMTQLLPFIMFGVGLDDAFIIIGAYSRTDPKKNPVQRVDDTMGDVGSSIFLTTITSSLAFALGSLSTVPIVSEMCHYAYTTLIVDFILQITFFIALLVLDERRIQANRRDCCACCVFRNTSNDNESDTEQQLHENNTVPPSGANQMSSVSASNEQVHIADRIMDWYAKHLLTPYVQVAVLVIFGLFFAAMCYSSTLLRSYFDFTDALPHDSYVSDYFRAANDFSDLSKNRPAAYFRCVDQSDEDIQQQMEDFIDALVSLDEVEREPPAFWLRDLKKVVEHGDLHHLTFNEQLDIFLDIPMFNEIYKRDIVRDERTGDIIVSRTVMDMNHVDQLDIDSMVNALKHQRAISQSLEINKPEGLSQRTIYDPMCEESDNWAFFMYEEQFPTWEFYSIAVSELVFSTIMGIAAVTLVGMLLIPHWTAFFFVLPVISITYVDLLGLLQFLGAKINAVTYVTMVMSIGLMVDFIMHILLRYYECEGNLTRRQRVIETLRTMGASVVLGGTSSFLGVLPLAISKTLMINVIFINFISLMIIGITHGLILLPVLLSLMGPIDTHSSAGSQDQSKINQEPTENMKNKPALAESLTTESLGQSMSIGNRSMSEEGENRYRTDSRDSQGSYFDTIHEYETTHTPVEKKKKLTPMESFISEGSSNLFPDRTPARRCSLTDGSDCLIQEGEKRYRTDSRDSKGSMFDTIHEHTEIITDSESP